MTGANPGEGELLLAGAILVGGYTTTGDATGIGLLVPAADGGLRFAGTAVAASDPSFLLRHPTDPRLVFAADEGVGRVDAFRVGEDGALEPVGGAVTGGANPCHLAIDPTARILVASCYGDGAVVVHPLTPEGAVLVPAQILPGEGSGPHPAQDGPHAHAALFTAGLVLTADLGSDEVHVHRQEDGALVRVASIALPAGAGPRDLVAHPSGAVLVLGEHDSRVHVLEQDGDGGFQLAVSVPATVDPVEGDQAAGLQLVAGGSRITVGLRGSNRIAVLDVAVGSGGTVPAPHGSVPSGGDWPRHHVVVGADVFVANERSGDVAHLRFPADGGLPESVGTPTPAPTPTYLLPL